MPHVTIRELALRARVSKSTASMALRNDPRISDDTRGRVRAAAQELGYQPNPKLAEVMSAIARHQVEQVSNVLMLLSDWPHPREWEREDYSLHRFYGGLVARAKELGFRIEELWLRAPGLTARRVEQILATRRVPGVIIFNYPSARAVLDLDFTPYPCAVIGRALMRPQLFSVDADHHQGMFLCLDEVKRHGYRRPGLLLGDDAHERTMHCWAAAFLFSQSQLKPSERIPIRFGSYDDVAGCAAWLRRHRPDVVISSTEQIGRLIERAGFGVPDDFATALLYHYRQGSPYAGVDICDEAVAGRAVDLVAEQIRNHQHGQPVHPETVLLPGTWRDGPTLPMRAPPRRRLNRST